MQTDGRQKATARANGSEHGRGKSLASALMIWDCCYVLFKENYRNNKMVRLKANENEIKASKILILRIFSCAFSRPVGSNHLICKGVAGATADVEVGPSFQVFQRTERFQPAGGSSLHNFH